jgi:hypothetical protein
MKGCRVFVFLFSFCFKGEGVALSYINDFRTAETISLNLGRNEVLMIPYKCCFKITFIKFF